MKLTATTILLFLISVSLVFASLIGYFRPFEGEGVDFMTQYKYVLLGAGYAVLAFAVIFKSR
ncbi:hypothetical protein [Asticcacaulis excentricus]|uniref:Uncharacterized protein n=1 Tax=Asticcacaulis excentricus (strain ATCC 15261 / DSM 4724 / KCTC 12464 / NCIMB 9791 / VKM B-1370 / CB 48) TaxID=573065 RepID=E8RPZ8_ASTEC|nr:hypothetical protein [Asticcacaulis excentricus]ADU13171.1 hypothetical protein Astex_1505 [Asticcacaulis excentricus CB 48]